MWKVFLSAAAAIGLALGQGIPAADDAFPVPPRPAFQIIDDARIFQHEPDRLRALADHLGDLRETHAFPLYLVIHDSLIGTSPSEQVQRLHDAWIGDGSGLVAVIETDSGRFAVSRPARKSERIAPDVELPTTGPSDLTDLELTGALARVAAEVLPVRDRAARAEALGRGLADEVGALLQARRDAPEPRTKVRTMVLGVGLLAGCGLAAMVAVTLLRRADSKAARRFHFPQVHVGQRLGAPYGGGRISSRSFRS